ncbi:hypothetical protein [Bizionia arctica]|uniref:Secreted protein n=1 Tax=Bizionia arctica TaxID=1495645 RepID=A0A917GE84_9FLAO|nr:hypothetical protein [Bizionia arctica]GGG41986.1 hypothetical protein GCM10010976_11910 [Bizionia arctica]
MFKKFLLIAIVFISSISGFSQNSVNDYKYVIVPNEYNFLDEEDEFQLNSISHFLFNKYGFIALKEFELFPNDLINNPCLALKADVISDSGTFKTKLKIKLINCKNETIFLSETGESYDKEYSVAYNKALREAFIYVNALNYNYSPNQEILALGNSSDKESSKEIKQLKEEIATLKQKKVVQTPIEVVAVAPVSTKEIVTSTKEEDTVEKKETILYANKTDNGYQLVNSATKVVMILLNTKNPEVFMVQGKNAMVFKEGGSWFLSENDGTQVKDTLLNIKF